MPTMYRVLLLTGQEIGPVDLNTLAYMAQGGQIGPFSPITDLDTRRQFAAADHPYLATRLPKAPDPARPTVPPSVCPPGAGTGTGAPLFLAPGPAKSDEVFNIIGAALGGLIVLWSALRNGGQLSVWFSFFAILSGAVATFAERKGYSRWWGLCVSLWLTPLLGFVLVAVRPVNNAELERRQLERGDAKRCPACAEIIRAEADKCRFCGAAYGPKP